MLSGSVDRRVWEVEFRGDEDAAAGTENFTLTKVRLRSGLNYCSDPTYQLNPPI